MLTPVAIFALLVTWLGYALICLGWGAWYYRLYRRTPAPTLGDFAATFWVGLATLLGVLQVWHFFLPINFAAHVVLTLLGLAGGALLLRPLWQAIRAVPPRALRYSILALGIFGIWIANRAIGPGAYYDAGLYHISAIKWTQEYAIVPGLANLHMRFGFSSTLTLFSALLNHGAWGGHANHLVNGFFLIAGGAMVVRSVGKVLGLRGESPAAPQHWLLVFSPLLLVDWAMDIQVSSYSTDLAVAVMTLAAAYYFLELFVLRTVPQAAGAAAMTCVALLAATITAKASALVLAGPMIAVAWLILWRAAPRRKALFLLPSAALAFVLVACWIARQIILAGYPLYPSEAFALPVDWAVPHEKVAWLRRIILNFARWNDYADTRTHWGWLEPWWKMRMLDGWSLCKGLVPIGLGMVALLGVLARLRRTVRLASPWRGLLWLEACVFLAMLAWWSSAPDPRYATQIFTLFFAGMFALVVATTRSPPVRGAMLILAALIATIPLSFGSNAAGYEGARTIKDIWLLPPPEGGMFYATPVRPYTRIRAGGHPDSPEVYIPDAAPGARFGDCVWDAPLPATPESEIRVKEVVIPELRWRDPGKPGAGFSRPR